MKPLIDNPTVCTHSELPVELIVHSYKDPTPSKATALYPETTDCATEVFRPVFDVGLTTAEADAPRAGSTCAWSRSRSSATPTRRRSSARRS